jgi:hypothetical protein
MNLWLPTQGKLLILIIKKTADWIELYNKGNARLTLEAITLTDNLEKTSKWEIPAGTQIAANGFLVFWADTQIPDFTPTLHFRLQANRLGFPTNRAC